MSSLQKTTKNNDIFRGFLCYWSYFFALLSPCMKGFINYVRISDEILKNAIYINKVSNKLEYLNKIDAELLLQRIYLRIMLKNRWIDEKKFKTSIEYIHEIGKIIGGLIKYYAKNNKK